MDTVPNIFPANENRNALVKVDPSIRNGTPNSRRRSSRSGWNVWGICEGCGRGKEEETRDEGGEDGWGS